MGKTTQSSFSSFAALRQESRSPKLEGLNRPVLDTTTIPAARPVISQQQLPYLIPLDALAKEGALDKEESLAAMELATLRSFINDAPTNISANRNPNFVVSSIQRGLGFHKAFGNYSPHRFTQPLQVYTVERLRKAVGIPDKGLRLYAAGHYAFDFINDRWLLVARYGASRDIDGEMDPVISKISDPARDDNIRRPQMSQAIDDLCASTPTALPELSPFASNLIYSRDEVLKLAESAQAFRISMAKSFL